MFIAFFPYLQNNCIVSTLSEHTPLYTICSSFKLSLVLLLQVYLMFTSNPYVDAYKGLSETCSLGDSIQRTCENSAL